MDAVSKTVSGLDTPLTFAHGLSVGPQGRSIFTQGRSIFAQGRSVFTQGRSIFAHWLPVFARGLPALAIAALMTLPAVPVLAQNMNGAKIIPPAPDAIGGGNPFQGLGRSDEAAPSRRSQFESPDPPSSSNSPSGATAGSTNPNVPPDLPPAPATDPIELRRQQEEKEKELEEEKKLEEKEKERERGHEKPAPAIDTPMKKALLELHLHNYAESLTQLDDILAKNPKDARAHYLKAVVFVLTRKYDKAEKEYRLVLQCAPSETLTRKAKAGLLKLAH